MNVHPCRWLLLSAAAALVGCDSQVYTAVASSDGSVVILNRYTGDVRKIQGRSIVELRRAVDPVSQLKPFSNGYVPNQPITVSGAAKYRTGTMILRVSIGPNRVPKDDAAWFIWRLHLDSLRKAANLRIQFVDADGFRIAEHTVALSDLAQTVDPNGNVFNYSDQFEIPMSEEDFRAVNNWLVGWSGYWEPYVEPDKKPQS